jgi:hypothetical protein
MQQIHIIHLKRRNILRTLLSEKISYQTNIWQAKGNHLQDIKTRKVEFTYEKFLQDIQSRKVELTCEELLTGFKTIKCLEDEFDNKFCSHPLLTIYYEDLVSRLQAEFERITNFLELPFNNPTTQYLKLNSEKLSTLIVNYEELKKEFSNTEWISFFEEEEN